MLRGDKWEALKYFQREHHHSTVDWAVKYQMCEFSPKLAQNTGT